MKLKCAIIDDDNIFTEVLKHYIAKTENLKLSETFSDADSALQNLDVAAVDFIFLDVEMPGMTGIELMGCLPAIPPVIFISQKKEYGVDAFELNAVDYLHKPISYVRFVKSVQKMQTHLDGSRKKPDNTASNESLYVKQEGMWIRIPVNEIIHIKADNDQVVINTVKAKYITYSTMKEIGKRLPVKEFMQIHRSYIVQLKRIDKLDGDVIEINNRTLPVSKTYLHELHKRLNMLK